MSILAIDPGVTGAVCMISGDIVSVFDLPVMTMPTGKKQINPYELTALIQELAPDRAVIEKVGAMPGQGVVSMFNFGKSAGIIEGVCAGLFIPVSFVTPQKWKKHHGLIGKDKDYARTYAIQTRPELAVQLKRKKDIGRADAYLMAKHAKDIS